MHETPGRAVVDAPACVRARHDRPLRAVPALDERRAHRRAARVAADRETALRARARHRVEVACGRRPPGERTGSTFQARPFQRSASGSVGDFTLAARSRPPCSSSGSRTTRRRARSGDRALLAPGSAHDPALAVPPFDERQRRCPWSYEAADRDARGRGSDRAARHAVEEALVRSARARDRYDRPRFDAAPAVATLRREVATTTAPSSPRGSRHPASRRIPDPPWPTRQQPRLSAPNASRRCRRYCRFPAGASGRGRAHYTVVARISSTISSGRLGVQEREPARRARRASASARRTRSAPSSSRADQAS